MTARLLTALALGALVAACGGSSDSAEALDGVPESAKASAAGFTSYVRELPAQGADNREPFAIEDFTPPTSDDTEPAPVSD
jgi:hypothetical protein